MFSIVIPLYNKELSIGDTIVSVLNQKFKDFELLIINDGSTDKSLDVVKTIKDHRIRIIDQKNQGVSSARNRGVNESLYDFIAFLDGDDIWKNNHLEVLYKMHQEFSDASVFVTSFDYSNDRAIFRNKRVKEVSKVENYFEEAITENIITSSNVLVKKNAFKVVGLFNENIKYGEDLDLWYRLAQKFDIIKSTKVTAIYRVDAENRSEHKQNLYKCFEYYIDLKKPYNNSEKNYLIFLINRRLYSYIRTCEFKFFFYLIFKHGNTHFFNYLLKKIKEKLYSNFNG